MIGSGKPAGIKDLLQVMLMGFQGSRQEDEVEGGTGGAKQPAKIKALEDLKGAKGAAQKTR